MPVEPGFPAGDVFDGAGVESEAAEPSVPELLDSLELLVDELEEASLDDVELDSVVGSESVGPVMEASVDGRVPVWAFVLSSPMSSMH